MVNSFLSYLQKVAPQISAQTELILRNALKDVEKVSPKLIPLADLFLESARGGKRIRGALVKLGYEIVSSEGEESEILKVSAAFEIFQTAILIHDDIIDLSELRRGKPTVYQQLGANHYATSQAISMGDIGFFLAVKLISETKFSEEYKIRALNFFSQSMFKTGLGEMLDVEIPHLKLPRVEEDVLIISHLKTAWYTIIGPLSVGAILGGADKKLLDVIEEFGEALGIAFQIQDDILGSFGSEEEIGKSATSDIEEGKNTLLIIHALKNSDSVQKEILSKHYGKGLIGKDELEQIRKIFVDTHALEYAQSKALEYTKKAQSQISKLTANKEKQKLLNDLTKFLIKRTK